MNEHIKKLLGQALDQAVPETWTTLSHEQITKLSEVFAELIVQECMACSTWVGKMNTNSVEPVHTAHAINQRIKQHFGVEE
jgi:hypothetical protein